MVQNRPQHYTWISMESVGWIWPRSHWLRCKGANGSLEGKSYYQVKRSGRIYAPKSKYICMHIEILNPKSACIQMYAYPQYSLWNSDLSSREVDCQQMLNTGTLEYLRTPGWPWGSSLSKTSTKPMHRWHCGVHVKQEATQEKLVHKQILTVLFCADCLTRY